MRIAEGVVVAGRYRLERPLARGGMGSVWIAQHTQLDAPVAVKFMDALLASSPAARARFEREAKAAAQIHSPHIVGVHDYGIEGETPFLVMELLHGEDLGSRIKRVGPLSLAVSADIIAQVARALRVAHAAGIVHRDLKPGNIFLVQNDDAEIAKVLDFGIAKTAKPVQADEATHTDQLLGSPQYMSPEQTRRSRDVDARTDLWALGVIAYRLITGKLPFSGELGDVLVKICTEQAPPPSIHNADLSPTVDRFFERALAKSPDHRFQTATALAQTFALAAGVNLPSIDKEPPRKAFTSTVRLGMSPVPPDATAATAAAAAEVDAVTVSPDTPTRPTGSVTRSSYPPESTTLRKGPPLAPNPTPRLPFVLPEPEPEPARASGPSVPRVDPPVPPPASAEPPRAPAQVARPPVSARSPVSSRSPVSARSPVSLRSALSSRSSRRSLVWTMAGTSLALVVGALLGGRIFPTRPDPALAGALAAQPSPAATVVAMGDTQRPPVAVGEAPRPPVQPVAMGEAPRPLASAEMERARPASSPGSSTWRASRPAPAKPIASVSAAPPPASAPPPPPPAPAPPPTAPHRMFGSEN